MTTKEIADIILSKYEAAKAYDSSIDKGLAGFAQLSPKALKFDIIDTNLKNTEYTLDWYLLTKQAIAEVLFYVLKDRTMDVLINRIEEFIIEQGLHDNGKFTLMAYRDFES